MTKERYWNLVDKASRGKKSYALEPEYLQFVENDRNRRKLLVKNKIVEFRECCGGWAMYVHGDLVFTWGAYSNHYTVVTTIRAVFHTVIAMEDCSEVLTKR